MLALCCHPQSTELRIVDMRNALERADELAALVLWFRGVHWFGPLWATDPGEAALRTAAFRFLREVHDRDPLVLKARDIANAVLEHFSQFDIPDSFEKLKEASNAYEQARLLQ
jgi:hypothetical protein